MEMTVFSLYFVVFTGTKRIYHSLPVKPTKGWFVSKNATIGFSKSIESNRKSPQIAKLPVA